MSDYIDTTFEFEGYTFPLRILTGSVLDTTARSDTHVYGGGDIGMGGEIRIAPVQSHVTVTQDLWLQCASGKERPLQFQTDFPVRPGHILQIAFLVGYKDVNASWLSFNNVTTDQGWTTQRGFNDAQTTDKKYFPLIQWQSSAAYFYLVKCLLVAAILSFLLSLLFNEGLESFLLSLHFNEGLERFLIILLFIFPVVFISGFVYRQVSNSAKKWLSKPFKEAAIAKFDGMIAQRAEAVEQLKASLAGTETASNFVTAQASGIIQSEKSFCTGCGKPVVAEVSFCGSCGTKLAIA